MKKEHGETQLYLAIAIAIAAIVSVLCGWGCSVAFMAAGKEFMANFISMRLVITVAIAAASGSLSLMLGLLAICITGDWIRNWVDIRNGRDPSTTIE